LARQVVGPLADDPYVLLGAANYAFPDGPSKGVTTVVKGLAAAVGEGATVHVNGCADTPCETADIGAATSASMAASATVLVLGDSFGGCGIRLSSRCFHTKNS
jgi:hypothetical protein